MPYSGPPYSGAPYSGSSGGEPISVGPVLSEEVVPGPESYLEGYNMIRPAIVVSRELVPGPQSAPSQQVLSPITPYSIPSLEQIPGPWLSPAVPEDPVESRLFLSRKLHIDGMPLAAQVQCQPVRNDVGTGSFVIVGDDVPELGDVIGFNIGPRRVFSGRVTGLSHTEVAQGDESAVGTSVDVEGRLSEWNQGIIMPDHGARDPSKDLRNPAQDERSFDWAMNGIGTYAGFAPPQTIKYGRSVGYDMTDAARTWRFALPDVWPDPTAKWMWVTSPNAASHPKGWCYFRVATPSRRTQNKIQFWACAYDYAEVWVDGVLILTCNQPGVAQSIELDATAFASHLVAIRAYNESGPAGVLFSMLPVGYAYAEDGSMVPESFYSGGTSRGGLYGPPIMNSRSNWRTQAYPVRPFRMTPGAALIHLKYEALWRGVENIPEWEFTFNARYDSAGRTWPVGTEPPLILAQVGMTYLDFLKSLTEDTLDFVADPYRRRLSCFVKDYGKNGLGDYPFDEGTTLESRVREENYA